MVRHYDKDHKVRSSKFHFDDRYSAELWTLREEHNEASGTPRQAAALDALVSRACKILDLEDPDQETLSQLRFDLFSCSLKRGAVPRCRAKQIKSRTHSSQKNLTRLRQRQDKHCRTKRKTRPVTNRPLQTSGECCSTGRPAKKTPRQKVTSTSTHLGRYHSIRRSMKKSRGRCQGPAHPSEYFAQRPEPNAFTNEDMDVFRAMHDRAMKQISSSRLVGSGMKFPSSRIAALYFAYAPKVAQMVSMDTSTSQPKQIRQGAYLMHRFCVPFYPSRSLPHQYPLF